MSDRITLRPVTTADLDLFEREFSGPQGVGPYQWFGFGSPAGLRRRFAETGLLGPDGGVLSVAEGELTVGRAERLQAWTDCGNLAEQRALEKAGFVREGVLRSAQWRGGQWHDQVIFSMLRSERSAGGGLG